MSELALKLIRENIAKHQRGEDATFLDLGNCGMTVVPEEIGACVWVERLSFSNGWQEWINQEWEYCRSMNEGEVNKINDLPPGLDKLRKLKSLIFNENPVSNLAPLADLTNLQLLSCDSTQVSDLAPLVGLTNLQLLYCDATPVSDLAPLAGLTKLQQLTCHLTPVSDLAPLAGLTNLQKLYCSSTPVSNLAPLAGLINLQQLACYSTPVSDLAPLAGLTNLQRLSCTYTQVSDLEPILHFINKGIQFTWQGHTDNNEFDFKDCPLITPPPEIVQQGNQAILNYFAERETGTEKSLEAKVVLIGEGMAGKTSLRTRLIKGEAAPLPPKDERTKGMEVEIEPFYVPLPSGESIRLNLFDFGGQKHYKPLHQFFYSHRSLYVLVTRNGDDSNEFDFWLDTAQLFGGGSPVLVVNNLFGDVPSGFSRSKYARFDAILKDSLDANLDTCKGFPAVKKRIEQLADDLPHIHLEIPKTWAKVRAALEKLRERNIIPLTEYLELCARKENGGMDKERALFCSAYLHDIGACLHYQQFPALKRYVIVRNEWATEAVYRVMDDAAVGKKNGHFHRDDLDRIWQVSAEDRERGDDFRYEEYQPELLELMRRFKLCYPLKSGDEFVAPHLLSTKQDSDLRWQPDNDLQFEVEYDFMPPALFSRFVVSRYEDIAGDNRDLVWSDEVFFNWDDAATANVRIPSRAGKNAIVFRVQGSDPEAKKLLLTSLLRDLKKLHAETPGIVAEERIPCICNSCRDTTEPTFYPYSILKTRKDNNKRSIECNKPPFEEVLIDDLLGNIFTKPRDGHPDKKPLPIKLIEELLVMGNLQEALELCKNAGNEEAILYLARFRTSLGDYGAGIIDKIEHEKTVAVLRRAALDLLKE